MGYVRVNFRGISEILGMDSQLYLLVLVDEEEKRQLVVTCDQNLRNQLKLRMDAKLAGESFIATSDRLLPEALALFMGAKVANGMEVCIESMREGKYLTCLHNPKDNTWVDIRCSDAILWAFVTHCAIKVREDVFAANGVPYLPTADQIALPVNVISDSMLELGLQKAIDTEDYETASRLRDELKRRQEKKE